VGLSPKSWPIARPSYSSPCFHRLGSVPQTFANPVAPGHNSRVQRSETRVGSVRIGVCPPKPSNRFTPLHGLGVCPRVCPQVLSPNPGLEWGSGARRSKRGRCHLIRWRLHSRDWGLSLGLSPKYGKKLHLLTRIGSRHLRRIWGCPRRIWGSVPKSRP